MLQKCINMESAKYYTVILGNATHILNRARLITFKKNQMGMNSTGQCEIQGNVCTQKQNGAGHHEARCTEWQTGTSAEL